MNNEQMLAALAALPEPDLLTAGKITDPLGTSTYYRADTVARLLSNAHGEPIDEEEAKQLADLCEDNAKSPKFVSFVFALAQLCKAHGVSLSTSGYDGLQVWNADADSRLIHCAGIEDCTTPNEADD